MSKLYPLQDPSCKKRFIWHPQIREVKIVQGRNVFPISWLSKQEYCEYQIYLENVRGIKIEPTKEMITGTREHKRLETEFRREAVSATYSQIMEKSKEMKVISREFPVTDLTYGIYGLIDEVWLTPKEFIIIDDKPGQVVYQSQIYQVYGYCLAFKGTIDAVDTSDQRQVVGAIRQRGTNTIFWEAPFEEDAETAITVIITRIHQLLLGNQEFSSNSNPNKCIKCKLQNVCDRTVLQS